MGIACYALRRIGVFLCTLSIVSVAFSMGSAPLTAQETWQKVQAFGVQLEVPANWKRFEFRVPRDDHDEIQFAENTRNPSAGAWFSVFPKADELIDPSRREQSIILDGAPAKLTDFMSRPDEPPPQRRQIIMYFNDKRAPAFLFDGDANKWSVLGPILARIQGSIRISPK